MPEIALKGCTPEPLMSYLKTLGVFRLVAEQADPDARLYWSDGVAHLTSRFDRDRLETFLLEGYRPTPITAPWNGGSGFYGGGAEPLDAIARSTAERLVPYRETIARIRGLVPKGKPKDDEKSALLLRLPLRARRCDRAVARCLLRARRGRSQLLPAARHGRQRRSSRIHQ